MKLCVLAPKQGYLEQAGVRIRYQRIAAHLDATGHSLDIRVIDDVRSADDLDHDAYLFSKVYDARSFIIARQLHRDGKLVGVDLFDDYFSQGTDSRFVRQREWLRGMAVWSDYVLCSTPRMRSVASGFMPELPAHILNDPYESLDFDRIVVDAERNLEETLAKGTIEVAWFGNGDNPHFSVGLKDVHAFGLVLHQLGQAGLKVRLRLLTNRRALTADGLQALGRLTVPWTVDEWSLNGEEALLRSCLVAFIPVNAQAFSVAKSLNRAVSALSSGTQVLSIGYPLYEPLHGFIYRDVASLLSDIKGRSLRVRRETLPALADRFSEWANPQREARRLFAFLSGLPARKTVAPLEDGPQGAAGLGVVHGLRSGADVHQLAQRHRHMSISSPFSNEGLNYDVRFLGAADKDSVAFELEERTLPKLRPDLHAMLSPGVSRSGRPVRRLALDTLFPGAASLLARAWRERKSRLASYATYDPAMAAQIDVVSAMFPGIELLLSEAEAPYGVDTGELIRARLAPGLFAKA